MRYITSRELAKLTIGFLKEYGMYKDYYAYFKLYYPDYAIIKDGFYIYMNNMLNKHLYTYYDMSLPYWIVFSKYNTWLQQYKKKDFVWVDKEFTTVCDLYNLYMEKYGCNNATILDKDISKDVKVVFPF